MNSLYSREKEELQAREKEELIRKMMTPYKKETNTFSNASLLEVVHDTE